MLVRRALPSFAAGVVAAFATVLGVLALVVEEQRSNTDECVSDTFCKDRAIFPDGAILSYQDCDGDGIRDPYCQSRDFLKVGFISSANNCIVKWPNGYCRPPASPPGDEGRARGNQITIIHFNDVYELSGVFESKKENGVESGVRRGGISRSALVAKRQRKKNPDRTFVFFAGDLLSPSTLSTLFEGAHMIDILNKMKIDAASLGNHEFDFGVDVLKTRLQESKFPWLNVNLNDETGGLFHGTQKYLIKDIPFTPTWGRPNTTRFCAFGAAYDVRQSIFKDTDRVRYLDIMNTSLSEATYLREVQLCDVVVALTHQDSKADSELSKLLENKVDLILGGHDHMTEYKTICKDCPPYVKADSDLKTQWVMKLFLGPDKKVQTIDARLMTLTDADPFDVKIHDQVLSWESKAAARMGEKIGCQAGDLDATTVTVRGGEAAIGNWFVDTIRVSQKTDVSIFNGGAIRGGRHYNAGDLNMATLMAMHPFGNTIAKVEATGAELRSVINKALDDYSWTGEFIHISGMNYTFQPDKPPGNRLIKLERPSGEIVGDEDIFSLALSDYMFTSTSFADNKFYGMTTLNDAVPLFDLLSEAVKAAGANCIQPKLDGRIQKI